MLGEQTFEEMGARAKRRMLFGSPVLPVSAVLLYSRFWVRVRVRLFICGGADGGGKEEGEWRPHERCVIALRALSFAPLHTRRGDPPPHPSQTSTTRSHFPSTSLGTCAQTCICSHTLPVLARHPSAPWPGPRWRRWGRQQMESGGNNHKLISKYPPTLARNHQFKLERGGFLPRFGENA